MVIGMSTLHLTDLAQDLASDGFGGHERRRPCRRPRGPRRGVSPTLVGILADPHEPEVARLRAFGRSRRRPRHSRLSRRSPSRLTPDSGRPFPSGGCAHPPSGRMAGWTTPLDDRCIPTSSGRVLASAPACSAPSSHARSSIGCGAGEGRSAPGKLEAMLWTALVGAGAQVGRLSAQRAVADIGPRREAAAV